ncbi:MAG: type II toxin-antitoxin system death-on-curing family toxin [Patescibacteria group bacterium]
MTEEKNSSINYISEEILENICHSLACELFQDEEPMGLYKDHDQAKLDASLSLPRQAVYGTELYPDIYKKAAILFYAINRNHAFGNGNKRLSVAVLIVFLYINDLILTVSQKEMRDKALEIAQTNDRVETIVVLTSEWIKNNSTQLKNKN